MIETCKNVFYEFQVLRTFRFKVGVCVLDCLLCHYRAYSLMMAFASSHGRMAIVKKTKLSSFLDVRVLKVEWVFHWQVMGRNGSEGVRLRGCVGWRAWIDDISHLTDNYQTINQTIYQTI